VSKRWRLVGSAALLGVLAWRLDWRALGEAFAGLSAGAWLAAVGVYVAAQAVSAWRWQLLAGALGCGGPWRRYLSHYFIGMYFNLLLPTSVGGDVVRGWYLARCEGRRGPAFLSVLADRVSGLYVLLALACVAALCCPVALPAWLKLTVAGLAGAALTGLAALPLLGRLPLGERVGGLVAAARLCLARRDLLLGTAALSLVVQLAAVLMVWLIGNGMGLRVPLAYYGVFVPVVTLVTLLPVSLNGMGLRELGTVALLAPLGVPAEAAVTLAVLQFAAFTAAALGGGAFYLSGRFPRPDDDTRPVPAGAGVEETRDAEAVGGDPDQGRVRQPPTAA
jgi:uncharacterized membrane protein YbhN (UPF0104 family)